MKKTPVIFVGHGSPMNLIEHNKWTEKWTAIGKELKDVDAIAMVSAHWFTKGTFITAEKNPKTIYDMYGFPEELYEIVYDAQNLSQYRDMVNSTLGETSDLNANWGYDHGTYSVLHHMYPNRDIPLMQVSIDATQKSPFHYEVGKKLASLRDKNILIIASGNIVHNLRMLQDDQTPYPWATEFNEKVVGLIKERKYQDILGLETTDKNFSFAAPTPDHFYPLLVALGASNPDDPIEIFNNDIVMKSLSMTGVIWG